MRLQSGFQARHDDGMNAILLVICGLCVADEPGDAESAALTRKQQIAILAAEPTVLHQMAGRRGIDRSPGANAARLLIAGGADSVPAVAELLRDENRVVRINAAWVLSAMRAPEAEAALLSVLDDESDDVRAIAVSGLRSIAKLEIRRALWRMLQDESVEVRLRAVQRLAFNEQKPPTRDEIDNYQRNQMIDALAKASDDKSSTIRRTIAYALGSYRNGNALQPLLKMLEDDSVEVRYTAADALGKTGNRGAVVALIEALADAHVQVVGNAAAALGELGDPRATEPLLRLLDSHAEDRAGVVRVSAEALGKIGDRRAVVPVIQLLKHSNEQVRRAAAQALGLLNDARAVEPLLQALDPKSAEVREVIEALGKLNDERAIEPIADALFVDANPPYAIVDSVELAARKIKHPRMVHALAERSLANPKHHGAFIARRIIGHLTDRGFDFDAEGFERWWKEHGSEY
jgi:HEAT repeat protein